RESCHNQDFVSRWGGEEFLILLPNTDIQGGAIAAEKIRQKISEQPFEINDQKLVITVSIGIAAYVEGLSIDDCIKQADSAMYQAKREGRNRVAVSSD
ncbi:MAG TPA: GGDEF domain-containing protein, partial [Candidatus Sumerlaeota bacterium]|nr:GGDEF domain-containing protein [Candidatus Sumerlaeota bacterium]